ncbi:hypothetical protein JW926_09225 [Candidatus Sumerlaeota bacterium]|nr:hypothetical protein [Candidatus Sumerlaeota bacterium]
MDTSDLLILSLKYFGGKVGGKTLLQKRIFFLGELLEKRDLGYFPHYYGPFSQDVSDCLIVSVLNGYVQENVFPYGRDHQGFEMRRYEYQLSETGIKLADILERRLSEQTQNLKNAVERFMKAASELNYMVLSYAAKLYYILKQKSNIGFPATFDEIKEMGDKFNWKIDQNDFRKGVFALQKLGLVELKQNP